MNSQEKILQEIQTASKIIREGGTLLYPTDTIWGIGCDARNEQAIEKIKAIKNRPEEKNFIILIHEENLLMKFVKEVPEVAWDLIQYSERPITIIYPGAINLPKNLLNDNGTIAIRVVKTGFAHDLMRKINCPLVSTSANVSGEPTPLHFKDVSRIILEAVDYVVDLYPAAGDSSKPSVIMLIETNGRFRFIRR